MCKVLECNFIKALTTELKNDFEIENENIRYEEKKKKYYCHYCKVLIKNPKRHIIELSHKINKFN